MGNLKYESNAEKIIENFKNMTVIAQKEGISFVNDSMNKVVSLAKPLTPVKSGNLRRGYRVVKARKLSSGRIVGAVINNEHYFKYVEEGQKVARGQLIALVDLAAIQSAGKNTDMVVVFTNGDKVKSLEIEPARDVKANDKIGSVSNKA
ncbi:hypothetical protein BU183_11050 [Enterococcus faecium]|nr:hypothetical protein BU183_11050 [Enterococcus faecium]